MTRANKKRTAKTRGDVSTRKTREKSHSSPSSSLELSDEDVFDDVARRSDFEDDEIDEDEAFNDGDEEKYADYFQDDDDDEEEETEGDEKEWDDDDDGDGDDDDGGVEDEDEGEDEDGMGKIMDSDDEDDEKGDDDARARAIKARKMIDESERRERAAEEDAAGEDLGDLLDSQDDEDETREQMLNEIVGERRYKNKVPERDPRYRPARAEELMEEDALAIAPGVGDGSKKLTLKDLMATIGEEYLGQETVKRLSKISKLKPSDVPLAPLAQQRIDRRVAYEEASKEVARFQPVVKANREKRTLKFEPARKEMHRKETIGALVADFTPRTELEKEIARVLQESGRANAKDERGEMLPMHEAPPEDAQARQAKLAKMRAVLFYHEQKAKRLKAIKSKTFHRLNRKGDLKVIGEDGSDEDGDGETPEERREYLRAQERAVLRHKNTSRWAQRAIKKGIAHLPGTREIMQEQLRIGQQLKQKIEGERTTTGEEESTDADSEDDADARDDDPVAERKRRLKAKAVALKIMEDGEAEPEGANDSLFKLPFMARAMEKKKAETRAEAQELLKELDRMEQGGEDFSDSDSEEDEWGAIAARAKRAKDGRLVSASKKARVDDERDEGDSDDDVLNGKASAKDEEKESAQENKRAVKKPLKRVKELSTAARNMRAKAAARANPRVHRLDAQVTNDDDEQAPTVMLQEEMDQGMNNADLMRRAFANDDIEAEFEKEKLADMNAELPNIDVPKNLPGWGSWAGNQRVPKWMTDAEKKANAEKAKALKSRRDAKLKHVIISEKYDKKAAAFNVESLPHGYSSKAAYEGAMLHPLGIDTNTDTMFEKLNAPKVLKPTGSIIKPLKLPKNKAPRETGAKSKGR